MAAKTKPLTLVIEPGMQRKLTELSRSRDVSVAQIVREAIRSYLEVQSQKVQAA